MLSEFQKATYRCRIGARLFVSWDCPDSEIPQNSWKLLGTLRTVVSPVYKIRPLTWRMFSPGIENYALRFAESKDVIFFFSLE